MKKEKLNKEFYYSKNFKMISVFLIIVFLIIVFLFFNKFALTGFAVGNLSIDIQGDGFLILISSPENITYNFSLWDNYTIDLNVSSNRATDAWWLTHNDMTHNVSVNSSFFNPNSTINAVRWLNELIIYANDSAGHIRDNSVIFYIFVNNTAPAIQNLDSEFFACENQDLDFLYLGGYYFNVTDYDENRLQSSVSGGPYFFLSPEYSAGAYQKVNYTFRFYSGIFRKSHLGGPNQGSIVFQRTVNIVDNGLYLNGNPNYLSDSQNINIILIEINNQPTFQAIPVATIYTQGENNTYYYQAWVDDIEDGDSDVGNLSFNISFEGGEDLFNISALGIMNFTANASHTNGSVSKVYNLTVCSEDQGLIVAAHPNISLCSPADNNSIAVCDDFSLTVTSENRAPQITAYYPLNLSFGAIGEQNIYFNITKYDPDFTIPDSYWYIDGILVENDTLGSSTYEFIHQFACDISGFHNVTVMVTDGLLNASLTWNITLMESPCPSEERRRGGGGIFCEEEWACDNWMPCQHLEDSYRAGNISNENRLLIRERCSLFNWGGNICGFQYRNCTDLNFCGTELNKSAILKECHYTLYPTCFDGIKNCHDGSCEVLIDCGGPCNPCPTCSDGIKNQGEKGIDCGGPCSKICPLEIPLNVKRIIFYSLLGLFLIIGLIIAAILINRYLKTRSELEKELKGRYHKIAEEANQKKSLKKV